MGSDGLRVLGVDPGTRIAGWAVVEGPLTRARVLGYGTWTLRGSLSNRLATLAAKLGELCSEFAPQRVALERNFAGHNVMSALRLGEARGAILAAAGSHCVPVIEYTPATVKLAVTGSGRASKADVQTMVARLLSLPALPAADAADALALALCHLQAAPFATRLEMVNGHLRQPRSRVKRGSP